MAHQFKIGDRVRLKDYARRFAEDFGLTGVLTFAGIDDHCATFEGTRMVADLADIEPAPPAPALIDPAKTYTTRDGRAVRIYATDGGFEDWQAVHGAVERDGKWDVEMWFADGRGSDSSLDLIEVKPEREGWVNVYRTHGGEHISEVHPSKTAAEACAETMGGYLRIACIPVKFREGDGL